MAYRTSVPRRARIAAASLLFLATLAGCRWHHPGHDSDYPHHHDHRGSYEH